MNLTAARIIRRGNILVSVSYPTKGSGTVIWVLQTKIGRREFAIINCGSAPDEKVDVVDGWRPENGFSETVTAYDFMERSEGLLER